MIDLNLQPTTKQLRLFGSLWLPLFLLILVWIARGQEWGGTLQTGLLIAAGVSCLIGLVNPAWIRPLFVGAMLVTFPIGFVVSHVVLALVYYGVFLPIGLGLRLAGRDSLQLRSPPRETYWMERKPVSDVSHYFRQF